MRGADLRGRRKIRHFRKDPQCSNDWMNLCLIKVVKGLGENCWGIVLFAAQEAFGHFKSYLSVGKFFSSNQNSIFLMNEGHVMVVLRLH